MNIESLNHMLLKFAKVFGNKIVKEKNRNEINIAHQLRSLEKTRGYIPIMQNIKENVKPNFLLDNLFVCIISLFSIDRLITFFI